MSIEPGNPTVWGWSMHAGTVRYVRAELCDAEGRWLKEPQLVVLGPNGGLYADMTAADHDLEKFALDILQALHDKREAQK